MFSVSRHGAFMEEGASGAVRYELPLHYEERFYMNVAENISQCA